MYYCAGRKCIDPKGRVKNFREVEFGFILEQAIAEAERCLQCKNPVCVKSCPAGVDIPHFIRHVKENNLEKASRVIKQRNLLPAICGRVCPQEQYCEKHCVLAAMGKPIQIGMLERYVGDKETSREYEITKIGKSAAVVGSGPAGIVAANLLSKRGFDVELFEAMPDFGGIMKYYIPEFRLPNQVVDREISKLKKLGVKLHASAKLGETINLPELHKKFDAVFLATGAATPRRLGIPGESLQGVVAATEFLKQSKNKNSDYKTVVVIGGGNTAVDSARVAVRFGCKTTVVYRKTEKEMSARYVEREHAKSENVRFFFNLSPVKILGKQKAETVVFKNSETKKEESLHADLVVVAIGHETDRAPYERLQIEFDEKNHVVVDENHMTSVPGVFCAGDAATGPKTVISAVDSAMDAVESICMYAAKKDKMSEK